MIPIKRFKTERSKIPIMFLGDWHLGHKNCNKELIERHIEWIKEHDGYIILMGDLMESSFPSHMTDSGIMWEQEDNANSQYETALEMLKSVKNRVLFLTSGNHENRIYNHTGFDVCQQMAHSLKCDYLPSGGYAGIKVNDILYYIAIFHGTGGSQNPRLQPMKAMGVWTDVDLIAIAHNHQLYEECFPKFSIKNGEKTVHKMYAIRTGGFLEYPEYAQERFFPLSVIGAPVVWFGANSKKIDANVSGAIVNGHD